jgi:short-subunit dehydrogenase involved in D-alanine esterification of teichoic acids
MRSIFAANRTALVTGASAGIGLELTRALAPRLDSLIVVARRTERLEQVAKELQSRYPALKIAVEGADLSDSDAVQSLLRRLKTRGLDVDVLVNNAGLGESELFERSPWKRIEQIVEVNIVAMLRLSHHLLPAMISRGHGAILNIGSGVGYAAMPNAAVYCLEALRAGIYGVPPCATCRHRNHRVRSRAWACRVRIRPGCRYRGWRHASAKRFPHHRTGVRRRYRPGIRERFTCHLSRTKLSLADESTAADATTSVSRAGRPSGSQNPR